MLSDLQYCSTEESEEEATHEQPRRVKRRITWERAELRQLKVKLDTEFLKSCTPTQKRLMVDVVQGQTISTRPMPVDAPKWAERQRMDTSQS